MSEVQVVRSSRMRRVILPGVALLLLAVVGAVVSGGRVAEAPPVDRVVVIHLDTTRYDDLGCNGGVARTPNIDAVASRGMRYTNAITTSPKTSPSVASFLTGRVPQRHGVYDVGGELDTQFTTLAEILRDRGFATGGFTSNPAVGRWPGGEGHDHNRTGPVVAGRDTTKRRSAGFDQGFDVYQTHFEVVAVSGGREKNDTTREHTTMLTDAAMEFIDEHHDEPFFLWMLHLDPHAPYVPPAPYDTMYLEHPALLADSTRLDPDQVHPQAAVTGRFDSHQYIARHLGEVTMVDHQLGRIFDRLGELPGRTLIVITADHGESFGDGGVWFSHGENVRWPCINVPLIIACDGVVPAGVSHALAGNIDLASTILDVVGVPLKALNGNGRSLRPSFTDSDPWPDRWMPIQSLLGLHERGVRSGDFCLHAEHERGGSTYQLFDLRSDPREQVNVADEFPDVLDTMVSREQDWFSRPGFLGPTLSNDPEMMRSLRALGYLGSGRAGDR